jgi:aryl-alcohol dehydrogenase-like predicted oxidoreductase
MKKRILGKTGLKVTELGLGGLFVSSIGCQYEQARIATLRALELGVNFVDTTPACFNSEEVLGKILEDVSQPLILSTKLGGRPLPFQPQNKDCLMKSVEESLKLLKLEHIDIMFIHETGSSHAI